MGKDSAKNGSAEEKKNLQVTGALAHDRSIDNDKEKLASMPIVSVNDESSEDGASVDDGMPKSEGLSSTEDTVATVDDVVTSIEIAVESSDDTT